MPVSKVCSLTLILFACCLALAQVREKETQATREQEVRDAIEKYNLAYEQKDVEAISKSVAPDLTVFAAGKVFKSWEEYRDNFLYATFARHMPSSTWEIEKVTTSSDMAWAYTKTTYQVKRQAQQVAADLYQLFILCRLSGDTAGKKTSSGAPEWKITVIDYSFHAGGLNQQPQPDGSHPRQ